MIPPATGFIDSSRRTPHPSLQLRIDHDSGSPILPSILEKSLLNTEFNV